MSGYPNNPLKINHHPDQSSTYVFSNDANNNFDQPNKKIQKWKQWLY